MAHIEPPKTADLQGMADLQRTKLDQSWKAISQHLQHHREHLKLSGWETYALKRVEELMTQNAHDELSTMLRDFFTIAGSNLGLEKNNYEQKRQKENGRN
ncbi:MAG: hypothetical protein HWD91_06015 [Marivivens sp.]|uniref:hypothetical protein n=1 Tax=Marivivens sp. TaxID=1978374 RepID=UPI00181B9A61|nr:hypothetical protein [Marivivens sp.]NVJ95124.1 hypothetical protein [Marivivens sp.]